MKDSVALSATIWAGALQAAATLAAAHASRRDDPAESAACVVDLAARMIQMLPEYDSRMNAVSRLTDGVPAETSRRRIA